MKSFFQFCLICCLVLGAIFGLVKWARGAPAPISKCTMKVCHCMERYDKVQELASAKCNGPDWRTWYKTLGECYAATHMDRCTVIHEGGTQWDTFNENLMQLLDDGRNVFRSDMGPWCQKSCTKADCACGTDSTDAPVCHLGHTAADHEK